LVRLLDGCLGVSDSRDRAAIMACYAPTAVTRISYGSPDGSWTAEAVGTEAIADAVGQAADATNLQRSGAMVMQGDFVAYPIGSSTGAPDPTGVEVIRLDPAHARIVNRWTLAGP
jgi:hypothetical protein